MAKKPRKKRKKRSRKNVSTSIPKAELDVLSCVWQEGPVTARRIRDMMQRYRPMAHGSVVTLLNRLEDKGIVTKEKGPVGKAFVFKALRKPEHIYRKLVKEMVGRVFGGNTATMVTALFDVHPPTVGELAIIQKAVGGARRKAKKTRRR